MDLQRKLQTIGKGTFVAIYDVVAQNYMKEDKRHIEQAVREYGLKTNGKKYEESSVAAKTSAACAIFREGLQKEALKLCQ